MGSGDKNKSEDKNRSGSNKSRQEDRQSFGDRKSSGGRSRSVLSSSKQALTRAASALSSEQVMRSGWKFRVNSWKSTTLASRWKQSQRVDCGTLKTMTGDIHGRRTKLNVI